MCSNSPLIQILRHFYADAKLTKLAYKKYLATNDEQRDSRYPFYNFWTDQTADSMWLSRFVHLRGLDAGSRKKLAFFSVYGPRQIINFDNSDIRVFYTGENLKDSCHRREYTDSFLNDKRINLSLGFESFADPRYLRMPLWVFYLFPPESTPNDIRLICKEINQPPTTSRTRFASLVASWDPSGLRQEMVDAVSTIDKVSCPGRWKHNDDSLKNEYGDVKMDYLRSCKFNLCPENTDAFGYTTEKLLQALAAKCVPVYWGSNNMPELGILNQDAILFWNCGGDNSAVLNKIRELHSNDKLYKEFVSQPRFTDEAPDIIIDMFDQLEKKLLQFLS